MAYIPSARKMAVIKSPTRIERAMQRRDVNGAELAEVSGVTRATISNVRRGKNQRVGEQTARRIERALGVLPGELFDYPDPVDGVEAV